MATTYKVLGQVAPTATTNTNVYTVPASTETVVSTIFVCNRGSTAATYRIAIRKNGNSISNEHYIAYDAVIGGLDSVSITTGITLGATDVVTVYASSGDVSFNTFGSEIS